MSDHRLAGSRYVESAVSCCVYTPVRLYLLAGERQVTGERRCRSCGKRWGYALTDVTERYAAWDAGTAYTIRWRPA